MVAAKIARFRRVLGVGGAVLAVGFLTVMALSGRARESGQFVRFIAAGVLAQAPADVGRVELSGNGGRWVFSKAADGWRREQRDGPMPDALRTHLEDAIKFLHASAPVRVLDRHEWAEHGLAEFGLDRPAVSAVLANEGRTVLAVHFGSTNPQKVLQYMRIEGRDEIYVMSRFVGEEWERALAEAAR